VVEDAVEESGVKDANEEVNPRPEDSKVEEANVDVTPEQEDADAEKAKEDVAPEAIVEKANEDNDTFDEVEGDNVLGGIPSYVYYGGAALIVLVCAICVFGKKRDGYTEIAP
jgi:hypothetical protein